MLGMFNSVLVGLKNNSGKPWVLAFIHTPLPWRHLSWYLTLTCGGTDTGRLGVSCGVRHWSVGGGFFKSCGCPEWDLSPCCYFRGCQVASIWMPWPSLSQHNTAFQQKINVIHFTCQWFEYFALLNTTRQVCSRSVFGQSSVWFIFGCPNWWECSVWPIAFTEDLSYCIQPI